VIYHDAETGLAVQVRLYGTRKYIYRKNHKLKGLMRELIS